MWSVFSLTTDLCQQQYVISCWLVNVNDTPNYSIKRIPTLLDFSSQDGAVCLAGHIFWLSTVAQGHIHAGFITQLFWSQPFTTKNSLQCWSWDKIYVLQPSTYKVLCLQATTNMASSHFHQFIHQVLQVSGGHNKYVFQPSRYKVLCLQATTNMSSSPVGTRYCVYRLHQICPPAQ